MSSRITLQDALKTFTADQDKILNPEETVRRFKEKTEKLNLSILKETKRIDNGRLDIPVFFSVCGHDATAVTGTNKQMGKGATPAQSEASAVMELAERYSFFSFSKNPDNFFTDTYRNVRDKAVSFDMIRKSVHDDSGDLDITRKIFEELPLQWTKGFNLTKGKDVVIPFNWFFMINEFNGPSAGNCQEEAISQGICEVVERHVSSIISHQRLSVPAVNPDSAQDPLIIKMINNYKKAGIELYVSDFSLDMGIPSIGVLAYDPSTFPEKSEIVWTAGTTPNPEKALSRALTETAQLAGDFNTASNYVASGLPKFNRLKEANFILNPHKTVDIRDLNDLSNMNIKTEVENLVSALDKKGLDVLLVNTMHPLLEIPAFYTIIPGAHFRERALGTSVGLFSAKLIMETNAPEKAVGKLSDMEKQLPGRYYIKFYLGSCHLSLNDPATALGYFEQALDLDPVAQDVPSIYSYMGLCFKDMEEYEKAISVLEKGRAADDQRTDIYNLMGFCFFKLKQHEKAIRCFKRVIELDPGSAIDYANIGSNYRDLGDREKAVEFYTTAITIDPTIDFAWDNLKKLQKGD